MKTNVTNIFLPQLKLIAKKYKLDLNCEHGYLSAFRILEGKGISLN
jgi:hypothetical protein